MLCQASRVVDGERWRLEQFGSVTAKWRLVGGGGRVVRRRKAHCRFVEVCVVYVKQRKRMVSEVREDGNVGVGGEWDLSAVCG